jgi:ParB-like chromosome segregation protein Spo0J
MPDSNEDENFEAAELRSVVVDFGDAARPRTDFAKDLVTQYETLKAAGNASNLKIAGESRELIHMVNPFLLSIKQDWNARDHGSPDNRLHVLELAHSIAEKGVLEPLTVHSEDEHIYITNGHCRYLAVMHLLNVMGQEISTVPIRFEDRHSTEADRIASQITRNLGKPLNRLEMARVVKKLELMGWSHSKIAKLSGKTRGNISQLLALHAATTPEIEQLVKDGKVAPTFVGRVAASVSSPEKVTEILLDAVANAEKAGKKKASAKHLMVPLEVFKAASASAEANDVDFDVVPHELAPAKPAQFRPEPKEPDAPPLQLSVPADKKRAAKDIFRRASVIEGDEKVVIEMTPEDYTLLRDLLGVPI